ncbi:MAG: EamA family transporter [Clostridiales bacterium]|nr:EamA family transporter [Clostridiales bacterium]
MDLSNFAVPLLIFAVLMNGLYSIILKPANSRCKSTAELQLFNACFTVVAMLLAGVYALLRGGLYMPPSGVLVAALFGAGFSVCVFTNLMALSSGPLSLTMLLINFSVVMPLLYSFCVLGEKITVFRIIGLALFALCMIFFTNPKVNDGEKVSGRWIFYSVIAMLTNGMLAVLSKMYAIQTDNAYGQSYMAYGYFFATIASFVICAVLQMRTKKEERIDLKAFFTPSMILLFCGLGITNFGFNSVVVLLATEMDGAIVYPAIQGGGPAITALLSRLIFKEKINALKAAAIALGIAAIVLLNI